MEALNRAAIVTGAGAAADVDYTEGDFVSAYEESIGIATSAFATEGVLSQTFRLDFGEFPGTALLGLAATEQFTHGWDLARAIGHHTDLNPARRVPRAPGVTLGRAGPECAPPRDRPAGRRRNASLRNGAPTAPGLPLCPSMRRRRNARAYVRTRPDTKQPERGR
jgi:hypothetical protein